MSARRFVTTPYYATRAAIVRASGRVADAAAEWMLRTPSIRPAPLRRAARFALRYAAGAAQLAGVLPRVDLTRFVTPAGPMIVAGDARFLSLLLDMVIGHQPAAEHVDRVAMWALPRMVADALADSPLVVCSLPQTLPGAWRPTAPLSFRTDPFVDQVVDLAVPLDLRLRGRQHSGLRHVVAEARAMGFSQRPTHDAGAVQRFFEDLYVPFHHARHGDLAVLAEVSTMVARVRRPDCELLDVLLDGKVVGAVIMRFAGPESAIREMGMRLDLPERVRYVMPTQIILSAMERARERECRWFRMGGSRPSCRDPVFRAKRRWGSRAVTLDRLDHPEWTWLARDPSAPLLRRLDALELVAFHDRRSCVVRIPGEKGPATARRPAVGVDGELLVTRQGNRFVPVPARRPYP